MPASPHRDSPANTSSYLYGHVYGVVEREIVKGLQSYGSVIGEVGEADGWVERQLVTQLLQYN